MCQALLSPLRSAQVHRRRGCGPFEQKGLRLETNLNTSFTVPFAKQPLSASVRKLPMTTSHALPQTQTQGDFATAAAVLYSIPLKYLEMAGKALPSGRVKLYAVVVRAAEVHCLNTLIRLRSNAAMRQPRGSCRQGIKQRNAKRPGSIQPER